MTKPSVKRCAIYTRKSSEEGLEQGFNSLHAQREACEAFIKSRDHEGWKAIKSRYDDGGFSGGTLNRPALQDLLLDIRAGKIDVIVVYKIDRLTRSLMDFSKLVEILDKHQVSFVSVTQHFNTTTSMGRLTLNVLLSFAQFEREVTGERIRDKFAASKKKGMWMGGHPPLGYDAKDRKLVPIPREAEQVRTIYTLYLEMECVEKLAERLEDLGIRSKRRTSNAGRRYGGNPFTKGALYFILQNKIYLGEIVHKDKSYPGEHDAIIEREIWEKVQRKLSRNRVTRKATQASGSLFPLKGRLVTESGERFTPTYTQKKNGKRYRYYICQLRAGKAIRLPVHEIESLILDGIQNEYPEMPLTEPNEVWPLVKKVVWRDGEVKVEWEWFGSSKIETTSIKMRKLTCGNQTFLQTPDGEVPRIPRYDRTLIKAVVRAWGWREMIEGGEVYSTAEIAKREKCTPRYVKKLLPLSFLSPEIVESIFSGTQVRCLLLQNLLEQEISPSWKAQKGLTLFSHPRLPDLILCQPLKLNHKHRLGRE